VESVGRKNSLDKINIIEGLRQINFQLGDANSVELPIPGKNTLHFTFDIFQPGLM
jgi:hypothetical protein